MNDIKALIGQAKLKEAIALLLTRTSGANYNAALSLQSRLNDLASKERMGTLFPQEAGVERARIVSAVLDLCDLAMASPSSGGGTNPSPELNPPALAKKKIFFSYSSKDRSYLEELCSHLAVLRRKGKIEHWDDTQLRPGEEWDEAIRNELATADLILLLVSADFLNTEYIWEVEIKAAMERHEKKTARVIPVFIRDCVWTDMPFGKLNGLPSKAKPVSAYTNRDEAWVQVVRGIESVL